MRRCQHSVMIPVDVEGDLSPYCSGCQPIEVKRIQAIVYECEADEKLPDCPICLSREFNYVSEDKYYFCPRCGFDSYTLY